VQQGKAQAEGVLKIGLDAKQGGNFIELAEGRGPPRSKSGIGKGKKLSLLPTQTKHCDRELQLEVRVPSRLYNRLVKKKESCKKGPLGAERNGGGTLSN